MLSYSLIIFTVGLLYSLDVSSGLNLQQAETDLAAGGSRVCPYCSYCGYQTYCDGTCSYAECSLCKYRYHCSSTCTSGVCHPQPCGSITCSANETCYEISPGRGECRCNKGSYCANDTTCTNKANRGDCEFYTCFENRRNCGSQGYMLGYGRKYCYRFGEHYDSFNDAGRKWIDCARKCLTGALIGSYQSSVPSGQGCTNLTSLAFNSHVNCYLRCGFCHVWSTNKLALLSVYNLGDFMSQQALSQVYNVGKKCLSDIIG